MAGVEDMVPSGGAGGAGATPVDVDGLAAEIIRKGLAAYVMMLLSGQDAQKVQKQVGAVKDPDERDRLRLLLSAAVTGGHGDGESADHVLWMDASSPDAVRVSLARTVRFTEWVMMVWPVFGKLLPECWTRHPNLVMEMDMLRLYAEGRWAKPGDLTAAYGFSQALGMALQHLRMWAQDDPSLSSASHAHGEPALAARARARRMAAYRAMGLEPDLSFPWPFDPATGEVPSR